MRATGPRLWLGAALFGCFAHTLPASAGELLNGEQLFQQLGGHAISGYYIADKKPFAEVYNSDGSIDYSDTDSSETGHWSVKAGTFCTFYDRIAGGCWYVLKEGKNCYEFYAADATGAVPGVAELERRQPTARAGRDDGKMSCALPSA